MACSTLPSVLESPSFSGTAACTNSPRGSGHRPGIIIIIILKAALPVPYYNSTQHPPEFVLPSPTSLAVFLSLAASVFSYSWHYFSPALRDVSLFTPTSRMNIKQVPPWHRLPHMHMCIGMRSKFSLQQLALFQRYA